MKGKALRQKRKQSEHAERKPRFPGQEPGIQKVLQGSKVETQDQVVYLVDAEQTMATGQVDLLNWNVDDDDDDDEALEGKQLEPYGPWPESYHSWYTNYDKILFGLIPSDPSFGIKNSCNRDVRASQRELKELCSGNEAISRHIESNDS